MVEGWSKRGRWLVRTQRFPSYVAALRFLARVARIADAMDHHPDVRWRYRTVTLSLTTHSAGKLTAKDAELARRINGVR